MNLHRLYFSVSLLFLLSLGACGGGGSSAGSDPFGNGGGGTGGGNTGGGGTTPLSNTLVVSLVNASGTEINPPALTGTQNATAVAVLRTSSGSPIANEIVTFSGQGLVFTPSTGVQITDSNGTARVQVRSADPLAGGATRLSGSTASNITGGINVALGAATAAVGTVSLSSTTVGAYQTVQVSVPVNVAGSSLPAVQFPVTFSASCGVFDPPQANTDGTGVARSTYRNQTGTTACAGQVVITAQVGTSSQTAALTATAPTPTNLQFLSASPSRIYLAGSPGVSQSVVRFKLVDSSGSAVAGQRITLTLSLFPTGTYIGSVLGTTSLEQSTDANGEVSVSVNAGTQPGPVQIEARLLTDSSIRNVSNSLAVASGLPVQKAFSLSVSTFNIEALEEDGVETEVTLRVADRLGNPVPDGTTVNFIAEGGQVVASCNTTGAANNGIAACSVKLSSQSPRPSNGRVSVLAWAQGEETFVDAGATTNNVYDQGESFEDLGQPFLDTNEDGAYQNGVDVTVAAPNGSSACPSTSGSVANTCDGRWGSALVRQSAVIVFSGNRAFFTDLAFSSGGGRCELRFRVTDVNGNPMPAGSTLSVSNITGGGAGTAAATPAGFGGQGDKVPNTSDAERTVHSAVFSSCPNPGTLAFQLGIRTPKGVSTTIFYP
jgi:hypothetical protein